MKALEYTIKYLNEWIVVVLLMMEEWARIDDAKSTLRVLRVTLERSIYALTTSIEIETSHFYPNHEQLEQLQNTIINKTSDSTAQ